VVAGRGEVKALDVGSMILHYRRDRAA
jgi:hypothetical protein